MAVRAERRRTEALRGRLAADIARGRAEAALPDLTELAAAQPLDEPLQALCIRALRASGRPAEALQAYEDVRGALADRLGTGPGPELRSLHAELLNPPNRTTGRGPAVGVPAAEGLMSIVPRLVSLARTV